MKEESIPLVTLSSDFAIQSQGVAAMEAVIFEIAPNARVIHLMHGLPAFDLRAAARTLETLDTFPIGVHVCICDPGVGSSRKALVILTARGDLLVGPDNGVLLPCATRLGGIRESRTITNSSIMRHPISPIFHGRDVFAPVAAHLSNGLPLEHVGMKIEAIELVSAPYEEAIRIETTYFAEVIQINRFGSIHLNISHSAWDNFGVHLGELVRLELPNGENINIKVGRTFSDVPDAEEILLKDDYGRIEIATNLGNFSEKFAICIGHKVKITRS